MQIQSQEPAANWRIDITLARQQKGIPVKQKYLISNMAFERPCCIDACEHYAGKARIYEIQESVEVREVNDKGLERRVSVAVPDEEKDAPGHEPREI